MILACRVIVALALFGIVCPTAGADVIPTRRAGAATESAAKIESNLVVIGAPAAAARSEVAQLTAVEAEYFAATPERLRLVGRQSEMWAGQSNNLWWEWIGGIAMLTASGVGIWIFAKNND